MKKISFLLVKNIVSLTLISIIAVCLIIYPKDTAKGVKDAFLLLGNSLIPSLFPFMVLSSYISQCDIANVISKIFEKPFKSIFRVSGYGIIPFILGLSGGYPVGAKTISEFYENEKISQNEAHRLLFWCINPSPAFTITAVGSFMLGNTKSGLILYGSCVLASLTVGYFCRFLSDGQIKTIQEKSYTARNNIFVKSVASGSEGMFAICGWVITFSVLSALCESLNLPYTLSCIIKSVGEVTTGCKNAITAELSLPVIAGILSFGGFAVICQCATYCTTCKLQIKHLICSRLINASLSAIYCSFILRVFPQYQEASVVLSSGNATITLYHSIGATIILFIMCTLLILEVDNHKKIC